MHFSSPSGQRFSWCRPWNRGAVGFFVNGYSSVNTFRNIVRKVTPNPATGSQRDSLTLATAACLRCRLGLLTGERWWHREPAGEGVELLAVGHLSRLFLRLLRDEHADHRDHQHDRGRDQQRRTAEVGLAADRANGG